MPVALYMVYSLALVVLDGVHQTLVDSNETLVVICVALVTFSFLLGSLVLPFVHKLHHLVVSVLVLTAIITGLITFRSFPFNHDNPLKLRFHQTIDLDSANPATVQVYGTGLYVEDVLNDLPSVKAGVPPVCALGNAGATVCTYEAPRPWILPTGEFKSWLNVDVFNGKSSDRQGPNKGEIFIDAPDVRRCELAFNTTGFRSNQPGLHHASPVRTVTVYHDGYNATTTSNSGWQSSDQADQFKYPFGIDDVTLHKLNWTTTGFHIGLEWLPQWSEDGYDDDLGVQVTCQWGEYDDDVVVDGVMHRKVPAFDEVLEYSPLWVSWANWGPGLVQVTKYVQL